jgi:hypothetical protein
MDIDEKCKKKVCSGFIWARVENNGSYCRPTTSDSEIWAFIGTPGSFMTS